MFKKIIVPLDGSKLAEVALPYVEELGAKTGSKVTLLSVLKSEEIREYKKYQIYAKKIAEITKYHMKKYVEDGKDKAIKLEVATRNGNPAEGIIKYARASNGAYPLIIMASHGRSGLSRWAVGSTADKVVRAAVQQPVMLIRAKDSRSDIRDKRILKKALVPLDGSRESEAVIPYISNIALKLNMELTFLQVMPETDHTPINAESYLKDKCSKLINEGVIANYTLKSGNVANEIINLADRLAYDLVAMSTHGDTGAKLWVLGSIAQKVFLAGNTPLLLVKQYQ